ncbi:Helix-turn-helix type 11 domain protein [Methanohalobium evestigatum Z-7303]|jgi:putative transcriptional regulator|uniref:Helix-turn-helix type 11 domain protein n=1 Tax=Methanohalobium evestigatum (strain ATCC BAA-1072 / DSM 3721 / NBRC 107634 / OCM 161 / Z-7303) TaxID=644295 RepID=D7EA98_METEZ|nr:winged helix-turn-helix transcriptional regulator [Methanohalobium evestigatum]ADI74769.1 Helix-turn-helix type 11 domain protein [Methanohalobium evestigatum Z-7303]
MIDLLQSKSGITKFLILIEVAAHQPNVRQKEIARKIGVTPQAVSEYMKELVEDGFIYSEGRVQYRITKYGVEWVLENAADMKRYARFVMSDIISHVSTWTAIAEEDLDKDEKVYLEMRDGLLYVSNNKVTNSTGITIDEAKKGEDVGVTDLRGLIDLEVAKITVCKIPKVERGGSKRVDLERLQTLSKSKSYIAAIGTESLIALKKIGQNPDVMFGAKESIVEAAFHGLSSLVLVIDEEITTILSRLESENMEYELIDLTRQ